MSYQPLKPVPTVSNQAIEAIYESFAKQAIRNLDKYGHVEPVVFLLSVPEGATEPSAGLHLDDESMAMMMRSTESKAVLANVLHAMLDASTKMHADASKQIGDHVNLVVMITETWVVMADKNGKEDLLKSGLPPSKHPNRTEAIMVNLHTSGGIKSGLCHINRGPDGKPSAIFEPISMDNELQGSMVAGSRDNREVMDGLIRDAVKVLSEAANPDGDPSDVDIDRAVKRPGPKLH